MPRRKKTDEPLRDQAKPAKSPRPAPIEASHAAVESEPPAEEPGFSVREPLSAHEPAPSPESHHRQFLTFLVADEEYALGILKIREILEFDSVTQVPAAPGWVTGVMNLRGTVVPVVDVAIKFGLPRTNVTKRTCVVVVEVSMEGELVVMGMLVDSVNRVVELGADDVEATPRFGTVADAGFLSGMGRVDELFLPILDVDRLLGTVETLGELSAGPEAPAAAANGPPDVVVEDARGSLSS